MENKRTRSTQFGLPVAIFVVAIGAVVATRLDSTVWAAIAGAICALGVGVPVTAMGTMLFTNSRRRERERYRYERQPPVVVVSPSNGPQLLSPPRWGDQPGFDQIPVPRAFNVIGDE